MDIVIDMNKVQSIQALFLLFETKLWKTFGSNLDGLEEVLWDEEKSVTIQIDTEEEFLDVFGENATKEYFGDRYECDMPRLSDILIDIFKNTATLKF